MYDNYLENYDVFSNKNFDLINQGLRIDKWVNACNEFGFSFNGGINNWLNEATERGIFGYTVIKLFKLEIIRNNNIYFNTEIRFQEDELFVLSYLAVCKYVKSVPLIGYFYFVPDWGKYIGGRVENKIYRTNLMIDVLQKKFKNPKELYIYKGKKNSLVNYDIEANIQHFKLMYLKNLRELLQEGYKIPKIPVILQKLLKVDFTLLSYFALILVLKIYQKFTKRKIEFI